MTPVRIIVSYREGVLDPAAQAVQRSLHDLGYDGVQDLTLSKQIDLNLDEVDPDKACELVNDMCDRLLVNGVMETYRVTLQMRAETDEASRSTSGAKSKS